jgi:hypothetical protein
MENGLSEYRLAIGDNGKLIVEEFRFDTSAWEPLPESWKEFRKGTKSCDCRWEDYMQLLLLLEEKSRIEKCR